MEFSKGEGFTTSTIDWLARMCCGSDVLMRNIIQSLSSFERREIYQIIAFRASRQSNLHRYDFLCAMAGHVGNSELLDWYLEQGVVPSTTLCFLGSMGLYSPDILSQMPGSRFISYVHRQCQKIPLLSLPGVYCSGASLTTTLEP